MLNALAYLLINEKYLLKLIVQNYEKYKEKLSRTRSGIFSYHPIRFLWKEE